MARSKVVIKGMTEDGKKFRPSDWAQRLATAVGSPGTGRRVSYHPKVCVQLLEGVNCVVLDKSLEDEEPMLYAFLTDFAHSNNLQIDEM